MNNNYITSVFHWNVTIWLVMKWSHDYKRDVLHPKKTQTRTCTCLHYDVRCASYKMCFGPRFYTPIKPQKCIQFLSMWTLRIECIFFVVLLACKSVDRSTFSMIQKMCLGSRFYTPIKLQKKMHSIRIITFKSHQNLI